MDLRHYRLGRDSFAFIGRRIIRLEPPYVMSVLLILCVPYLAGLTPWFDGGMTAHDVYRAALHLFYLVPWAGEDWFSAVYWSLAIEFQYYFLVLAAAPVLLYRKNLWPQRAFFIVVMAASYGSGESRLVFMYLPVFGRGRLTSAVAEREALRDAALAGYEKAVLQALSDAEMAMVRYDLPDLRLFFENDLQFLKQFP